MASAQGHDLDQTFQAEESLASAQYLFVKVGTAAYQCKIAGAGERVLGINQGKAAITAAAQIRTARGTTSKLVLGDTVTIGQAVMSDNAGKGVAGVANLDKAAAIALEAGVVGDIIEVMLADIYVAAS